MKDVIGGLRLEGVDQLHHLSVYLGHPDHHLC